MASSWRALKINRWSSSSRRAVRTNLSNVDVTQPAALVVGGIPSQAGGLLHQPYWRLVDSVFSRTATKVCRNTLSVSSNCALPASVGVTLGAFAGANRGADRA